MAKRGIRPPEMPGLLRGNQFHPCAHAPEQVIQAGRDLAELLKAIGDGGLRERTLLEWFGASTARIALLAHAAGRPRPQFVAREFNLCDMRADFALLEIPPSPDVAPYLLLVECQGALPNSLFEASDRTLHYWGHDFLDGFSQLMDWHFVGYHEMLSQKIASLAAGHRKPLETMFMLVAGLQRFSMDALSERRLVWWANTVSLGTNFKILRFDDIAHQAIYWMESYGSWGVEPARDGRHVQEQQGLYQRSASSGLQNDKAALAGRPHSRSGAGAGT
ncbi:hypothetical protein [Mitsuaria sp. GD03876]|uniref:hypothetical protein n=1 Tax=Mitsuaria sp. GD03876 TaxID=2975399 RepID=UPI00244BA563|nr:hypothetical protein [Mitsuaria sp. GD03876]MDH0867977.1 hypothetical protein [Mitsuaria sp. GD03876]